MDNAKKILLIEDDLDTRNLYSDVLKTKGYEVDIASDGEEGLAKARAGRYVLILLDIMLPRIDGLQVLSILKKEDSQRRVAIFTNLSSSDLSEEAKKNGADEFILKSDTDPGKLLEIMKSLIE